MGINQEGIKLPNGWEVDGYIGQGSFSTVYRAKRLVGLSTEWAAVKHISMPLNQANLNAIYEKLGTDDPKTINEYLSTILHDITDEYYQTKNLQGQTNIVACYDIQQIPKPDGIGYDVYIWMELLESLSYRVINGKMDRTENVHMGMDICQALSLLKSKGIVHRDIKPQNIFVNDSGDYKLGFGSAIGIKDSSGLIARGISFFMSPEIMQGRPAGFTSDIYSLGLVMYRLMNKNRHPFMQEGDIGKAGIIVESNARRLSGEALPMPVEADEQLGRIILKACAFEPKDRWQSPEDMYNALAELSEGTIKRRTNTLPPEPPSEIPPQPEPPKTRKNKQILLLVIATLLVALIGYAVIRTISGLPLWPFTPVSTATQISTENNGIHSSSPEISFQYIDEVEIYAMDLFFEIQQIAIESDGTISITFTGNSKGIQNVCQFRLYACDDIKYEPVSVTVPSQPDVPMETIVTDSEGLMHNITIRTESGKAEIAKDATVVFRIIPKEIDSLHDSPCDLSFRLELFCGDAMNGDFVDQPSFTVSAYFP